MPPVEHQKCVGSLDVPLPDMVLSSQRKDCVLHVIFLIRVPG
jgi:hypothetical protein